MWLNNKNEIYLNIYEKELKKRKEEYENTKLQFVYQKVISEEAELLKKLVPDQKIAYYYTTYYYLLKNGYLSVNHKFETSVEPNELSYEYGISITNGSGCCRNISLHLKNILKYLKINNVIAIGTAPKARIINASVDSNSSKIESAEIENIKSRDVKDNQPTHMELLDLKNFIIFDPTNFKLRKLKPNQRCEKYNLIDPGVRIYMDFTINPNNIKRIYKNAEIAEEQLSYMQQDGYKRNDVMSFKNLGAKICLSRKEELEQYQQDHQPLYQYVKEETVKRRNR